MTRTKLRVHCHNEAIDACLSEVTKQRKLLERREDEDRLTPYERGLMDSQLVLTFMRLEGLKK
jgi:hypothetical protein